MSSHNASNATDELLYSDLPSIVPAKKKKGRFDEVSDDEIDDDDASLPSFSAYDSAADLSDYDESTDPPSSNPPPVPPSKKRPASPPSSQIGGPSPYIDLHTKASSIGGSNTLTYLDQSKFLSSQLSKKRKLAHTMTLKFTNLGTCTESEIKPWLQILKVNVRSITHSSDKILVILGSKTECTKIVKGCYTLKNYEDVVIEYSEAPE